MARAEFRITINRPVEDVFVVLTDPATTPKWAESALEGELVTPGDVRVGSRRRSVVKGFGRGTIETVMEVTEYEPNHKVALGSVEAPVPMRTSYTFTPVGGGTRVDWTWWFEPTGLMKPAGPLLAAMFKRQFARDLANLKAMMESGRL